MDDAGWLPAHKVPWAITVLEKGKQVVDDYQGFGSVWMAELKNEGFRSSIGMPVLAGATPIGLLVAASRFSKHFEKPGQAILHEYAATIGANIGLHRALRGLESNLDRADAALFSVLPNAVTKRLKRGELKIADRISLAGVFFCDLAGFTEYSSSMEPEAVVAMLQDTFAILEEACAQHQVEKIKTIGDAFMAVSGVSLPVEEPILAIANFAMAAAEGLETHLANLDAKLGFRIGIHAGPVLAGVLGSERLFFDI